MSREVEILKMLAKSNRPVSLREISAKLNLSNKYVSKILSRLERKGLIRSLSKRPKVVHITKSGLIAISRDGMLFRLENLRVVGRFRFVGFDFEGFRDRYVSWDGRKGYYLLEVGGCKVYLFDGGSFMAILPRIEYSSFLDAMVKVFNLFFNLASRLYKLGVLVEVDSLEQVNQEIAFPLPEYEKIVPKGLRFQRDLGRPADGLLGRNRLKNARVWIDRSQDVLEIESNDLKYIENLVLMPERIKGLLNTVEMLSKNQERMIMLLESLVMSLQKSTESIEKLAKTFERLLGGLESSDKSGRGSRPRPEGWYL